MLRGIPGVSTLPNDGGGDREIPEGSFLSSEGAIPALGFLTYKNKKLPGFPGSFLQKYLSQAEACITNIAKYFRIVKG